LLGVAFEGIKKLALKPNPKPWADIVHQHYFNIITEGQAEGAACSRDLFWNKKYLPEGMTSIWFSKKKKT
jgi:hypothetical protein